LKKFTGGLNEKTRENYPIYVSLKRVVYDVSSAPQHYGPDGGYAMFSGNEVGVALAKMSFDPELFNTFNFSELNFGENEALNDWIVKFRDYKSYPVVGYLKDMEGIDVGRIIKEKEFKRNDGSQKVEREVASIYVGCGGNVFDCSFGGVEFYGPSGPYKNFAGKDATWALARMKIDDTSVQELDAKETKVLGDWRNTFEVKKGYPIVGKTGNGIDVELP